jgi:hypothetical protein
MAYYVNCLSLKMFLFLYRPSRCVVANMCILLSKTQHMHINALMKYQLQLLPKHVALM